MTTDRAPIPMRPRTSPRRTVTATVTATAVLIATALTALACRPAAREVEGDLAFVGATVLPMDGRDRLESHTVVIAGDRIVAVAPSDAVTVSADTKVIDAAGKFLMPGVAEMHGHYPQDAESQLARDVLFLYVANGVTFVRGMQGGAQHLPLRDAIERGEVLGPRLLVSAPMLHGGAVTDPDQAEALVREAAAAGFDHLKVHEGLSLEVYDRIAATAKELGLPFAGHVSNLVGLRHALEQGQQTIDHLDNYLEAMIGDAEAVADLGLFDLGRLAGEIDASRLDEIVAATVEAGTGVVPTMALWEVLFGSRSGAEWLELRPETRYMPAAMVEGWVAAADQGMAQLGRDREAIANILALRRRVLAALHDAGVPVLFGTDSPQVFSVPGFSIHHEMQVMVESGLTPAEVLATGTTAVADFLGLSDEMGSVSEGRRADLVLLHGDPTEDVSRFADRAGVVVAGRWLGEQEIDAELEAIAERAAAGG
ncbi:MAG TPA: amidohydrolase family protein [Thermoanaerobaculia bacterium]|nr:amidohydrolase family protein [Thermoanaerobaculia bacterium]